MHSALQCVAHRPWPLPAGPWVMVQAWHDLLFAHWPVAQEVLRPLVPPQLPLDTWEGECWVGVVPFWMSGVRVRGIPAIPGLSRFPELNVRTYVIYDGKPGVYFFSLDAGSHLAVWSARSLFHLPYFYAEMNARNASDEIEYRSSRRGATAEFRGRYRPTSEVNLPIGDSGALAVRAVLFVHGPRRQSVSLRDSSRSLAVAACFCRDPNEHCRQCRRNSPSRD